MKGLVILGLLIVFIGFVSALPEDDIHVNIQTVDSGGSILTGTFDHNFTISTNSDCSSPLYNNLTTLTTDSNGINSYYIEGLSAVDFSQQLYMGHYRDNSLVECIQVAYVPYSFFSKNASWSNTTDFWSTAEGIFKDVSDLLTVLPPDTNVTTECSGYTVLTGLGTCVALKLIQLADLQGPITNAQILRYDATSGNFTAQDNNFSLMNDVNVASLLDGDHLKFNQTSGRWEKSDAIVADSEDILLYDGQKIKFCTGVYPATTNCENATVYYNRFSNRIQFDLDGATFSIGDVLSGMSTTRSIFSTMAMGMQVGKEFFFGDSNVKLYSPASGELDINTTVDLNIQTPTFTYNGSNVCTAANGYCSGLGDIFVNETGDTMTGQLVVQDGNGRIISTNAGGAISVQTSAGQAGYLSFGNTADIGISTDGIEGNNWDSDGSFIFKQKGSNPDGLAEFVFIEEAGDWRFALPGSGADYGTYNPRSMIIAGPSLNNDTNFECSGWGFDQLACDTSGQGADLGVQNFIQTLKGLFTPTINGTGTDKTLTIGANNTVFEHEGEQLTLEINYLPNQARFKSATGIHTLQYDIDRISMSEQLIHTDDKNTYITFPAQDTIEFVSGDVIMMSLFESPSQDLITINPIGNDTDFAVNTTQGNSFTIEGSSGNANFYQNVTFNQHIDTGYEIVEGTSAHDSLGTKSLSVGCSSGKKVMGGGANLNYATQEIALQDSYPSSNYSSWELTMVEGDGVADSWNFTGYAICSRFI